MKFIIGLGNPGRKYDRTRHNIGFEVAAEVAKRIGAQGVRERFDAEIAEGSFEGTRLLVLCPQTFMNASGRAVRKAVDFYKVESSDLLVVCDDLNLPTGKLRIRAKGSAGGQKGLADIIRHLGDDSIARLRIGIDRPPAGWEVSDYVLGKFTEQELDLQEPAVVRATEAALLWAKQGAGEAMNRYNAAPEKKEKSKKKTKSDSERGSAEQANSTPTDHQT